MFKGEHGPLIKFLVVGVFLYLSWYSLYEFVLKPHTQLDEWAVENLVWFTEGSLELVGFELWERLPDDAPNKVGIAGTVQPITIGAPCDGIILWALFTVFIIAFPGPIRHKMWYFPVGIILIHLINVARITALAIIMRYHPEQFQFNHDYTFTIVVYSFVFLLWYLWVTKFSPLANTDEG